MNSKLPNFRHLRAFREVAQSGSISQAAPLVHLSQPAITQALARLEEMAGVPLFHRRNDGMFPTDEGKLFLDRVERALSLVQQGAREAVKLGMKKGSRGFPHFDQLLTTAQLRALVAVSEARNFSLAARNVGLSQPSLHRAARDLERLSGLTLFSRTAHGIELTPAADILAQQTRLAFAELEQGYAEIEESLGVDRGRIIIGTMPLPRTYLLPTAINALLNRRPETRFQVIDGPYDDLLHGLRHGEMDLLVGALRDPLPAQDVVQEELFSDPLAVVGRVGHPLTWKDTVTVDDLAACSWVVPRRGTPTRQFFDSLFGGEEPKAGILESSSLVLIRELLLGSDRLTLISPHQIRHERRMGLLVPLNFEVRGSVRPIGVTCRKDWRPTKTQSLFLDCLRDAGAVARNGS